MLIVSAVSAETPDASTRVWLEVDETQLVKNVRTIAGKKTGEAEEKKDEKRIE